MTLFNDKFNEIDENNEFVLKYKQKHTTIQVGFGNW